MLGGLVRQRTLGIAVVLVLTVAAVVGVAALAVAGPVAAQQGSAATPIDSCTVIDEPGNYVLTENIRTDAETCIEITSSNVDLQGQEFNVVSTADAGQTGILTRSTGAGENSTIENIVVRNVEATGWERGIQFRSVDGGAITGAVAMENMEAGIELGAETTDVVVDDGTLAQNFGAGIRLTAGAGPNTIEENDIEDNGAGITVRAPNTTVQFNDVARNGRGIVVSSNGDDTMIRANTVTDSNGYGILVREGTSSVFVVGNEVRGAGIGIGLLDSVFAAVNSNEVRAETGVDLSGDVRRSFIVDNLLITSDEGIQFGGVVEYTGGDNVFAADSSTRDSNVAGGSEIGGNYYGTPAGTGFSKTCADADRDGICDSERTIGSGPDGEIVDTKPVAAACRATPVVGDQPPTDPDRRGDYDCEDVNGDGGVDVVDVQALFANRDSVAQRSDAAAFDFNGQNGVDVVDIQRLFAEIAG